jgi:hypothetical protein
MTEPAERHFCDREPQSADDPGQFTEEVTRSGVAVLAGERHPHHDDRGGNQHDDEPGGR